MASNKLAALVCYTASLLACVGRADVNTSVHETQVSGLTAGLDALATEAMALTNQYVGADAASAYTSGVVSNYVAGFLPGLIGVYTFPFTTNSVYFSDGTTLTFGYASVSNVIAGRVTGPGTLSTPSVTAGLAYLSDVRAATNIAATTVSTVGKVGAGVVEADLATAPSVTTGVFSAGRLVSATGGSGVISAGTNRVVFAGDVYVATDNDIVTRSRRPVVVQDGETGDVWYDPSKALTDVGAAAILRSRPVEYQAFPLPGVAEYSTFDSVSGMRGPLFGVGPVARSVVGAGDGFTDMSASVSPYMLRAYELPAFDASQIAASLLLPQWELPPLPPPLGFNLVRLFVFASHVSEPDFYMNAAASGVYRWSDNSFVSPAGIVRTFYDDGERVYTLLGAYVPLVPGDPAATTYDVSLLDQLVSTDSRLLPDLPGQQAVFNLTPAAMSLGWTRVTLTAWVNPLLPSGYTVTTSDPAMGVTVTGVDRPMDVIMLMQNDPLTITPVVPPDPPTPPPSGSGSFRPEYDYLFYDPVLNAVYESETFSSHPWPSEHDAQVAVRADALEVIKALRGANRTPLDPRGPPLMEVTYKESFYWGPHDRLLSKSDDGRYGYWVREAYRQSSKDGGKAARVRQTFTTWNPVRANLRWPPWYWVVGTDIVVGVSEGYRMYDISSLQTTYLDWGSTNLPPFTVGMDGAMRPLTSGAVGAVENVVLESGNQVYSLDSFGSTYTSVFDPTASGDQKLIGFHRTDFGTSIHDPGVPDFLARQVIYEDIGGGNRAARNFQYVDRYDIYDLYIDRNSIYVGEKGVPYFQFLRTFTGSAPVLDTSNTNHLFVVDSKGSPGESGFGDATVELLMSSNQADAVHSVEITRNDDTNSTDYRVMRKKAYP